VPEHRVAPAAQEAGRAGRRARGRRPRI